MNFQYVPSYCRYLADIGDLDGVYGYLKELDFWEKYSVDDESFKVCIYLQGLDGKMLSSNTFFANLYEKAYVNYDKAWFCTLKYKGLDLSDILNSRDVYKLSIYIHTNIYDADSDLIVNKKFEDSILEENEYFKVFSIGNQVYFEVK